MSTQCTNYMDGCALWIHGVHTVSSKDRLTIASTKEHQKYWQRTLYYVLPECFREHWCQMLYWLVVTRLCNTHSLVECSHVKTMLGQREALEEIIVPIGLPSYSICCSIRIAFRAFQGLLDTKLPQLLHAASFVSRILGSLLANKHRTCDPIQHIWLGGSHVIQF